MGYLMVYMKCDRASQITNTTIPIYQHPQLSEWFTLFKNDHDTSLLCGAMDMKISKMVETQDNVRPGVGDKPFTFTIGEGGRLKKKVNQKIEYCSVTT